MDRTCNDQRRRFYHGAAQALLNRHANAVFMFGLKKDWEALRMCSTRVWSGYRSWI